MNQLLVDPGHLSGHLSPSYAAEAQSSVSNSDARAAETPRRTALWPVAMIGLGGIATLAWNGFLLWHTARAVIGWVGVDL